MFYQRPVFFTVQKLQFCFFYYCLHFWKNLSSVFLFQNYVCEEKGCWSLEKKNEPRNFLLDPLNFGSNQTRD